MNAFIIIFHRLHLHNEELGKRLSEGESRVGGAETGVEYVSQFGFPMTTCCGYLPLNNEWVDDWVVSINLRSVCTNKKKNWT